MLPEKFLKSDVLDILFEGKNQLYGAYVLRKNYPTRLLTALGLMMALVAAFILLQSFMPKAAIAVKNPFADIGYTLVELQEEKKIEKPLEQKKEQSKPATTAPAPAIKAATVDNNTPIIVPDNKVIATEVPDIDEMEGKLIGSVNTPGPSGGDIIVSGGSTGDGGGESGAASENTEPITTPIPFAEIMPEFPGGMAAFKKFMERHLNQPDDLEPGEKKVVIVKFVVEKDGSIGQIELIQNAGLQLDQEVVRVINKMPKWKAGMQNGRSVAVYYRLPVTFVGSEY
jgi:periplasmic protein TonB